MGYEKALIELHSKKLQYSELPVTEQSDKEDVVMGAILAEMQKFWPGPYTVEEYYNTKRMAFALRLKFEDKNQELMWRIKHS